MPPRRISAQCLQPWDAFQSQRGQDKWVLSSFNSSGWVSTSRERFFYVDLAAQQPACFSNTWALDRRGWQGICIEAASVYVAELKSARTCTVVQAAVDSTVHQATFLLAGGYGGLVGHGMDNFAQDPRGKGSVHPAMNVTTRHLLDILTEARAPRIIHYLSLDVEGAEARALTRSVLQAHTFLTITIERPPPVLASLLFEHGYLFVQNVEFDGFFVHKTHPQAVALARNSSFEYLPAKCTPHSPSRIKHLYEKRLGTPPSRCSNAGYYTIYSDHHLYKGACCFHRPPACFLAARRGRVQQQRASHDCIHLNYGPPTSKHVLLAGSMPS